MKIKKEILYDLADITILPAETSKIVSRSECKARMQGIDGLESKRLPIIASPMSSVVSPGNYKEFHEAGLNCIIPRNIPFDERLELFKEVFCAFSLSEVKTILDMDFPETDNLYILIDIANGHMKLQIDLGRKLRLKFKDKLFLMGGNIARPKTILEYCWAGFDYVRVGIAGGSRCLTGTQTGIYYPMASLIADTRDAKGRFFAPNLADHQRDTLIVADGGIGSYSDIIKALALGADYVMCGSIFAKAYEAAGIIYSKESESQLDPERCDLKTALRCGKREYYGMSTKKAQSEIGDTKKKKTSEGKTGWVDIEYSLAGWSENMDAYLRSSMSYVGVSDLWSFWHESTCQVMSAAASHGIGSK